MLLFQLSFSIIQYFCGMFIIIFISL